MENKRKQIVVFSGLGADYRVFQNLNLVNCELQHVVWIMPEAGETLSVYAKRISAVIHVEKPILMGMSFGGMVAQEVAKLIDCEKLILISSAKSKREIPKIYRLFVKLKLHKLVKLSIFRRGNALTNWFFSCKSIEDKALLKPILEESDPDFLLWAIEQIAQFDQVSIVRNTFHIHGDSDRALPLKNIHCDAVIRGGGHFMVFNKAQEISNLLNEYIRGEI